MIVRMRKYFCLILVILMASQASGYLGVIPSQKNLGTVERGETYDLNIYVTSDTEEPIEIRPQTSRVARSTLVNLENVNYFDMQEYSAESIDSWIDFSDETYTVRPEGFEQEASGREINANVSYELDIPGGAEPGYHAAEIDLNPQFESGEGTRVRTVGVSTYSVFFRVPGEVNRDLEVSNVRALRSADDAAIIRADVTNTGSVTTFLKTGEIGVTGSGTGDSFTLGGAYIAPGETREFETTWSKFKSEINAGNYQLEGSMSYATGRAFLQETVSITDFIQIRPSQSNDSGSGVLPTGQGGNSLPLFLIVMFLVIVGSVMYAFEIDPLLIIMAMAVVGASSVIYFSSLPAYYIAGVLLVALGLFYYGWL